MEAEIEKTLILKISKRESWILNRAVSEYIKFLEGKNPSSNDLQSLEMFETITSTYFK